MSTGIGVSDESINTFQKVKSQTLDFAFFKIDKNLVVPDDEHLFPMTDEDVAAHNEDVKSGEAAATFQTRVWPKFIASLEKFAGQKPEPRYIVIDFGYVDSDNRKVNKLIYVNWCPDNCGVRKKMLAAGTAASVMSKFEGLAKKMQAQSLADVDYEACLDIASQ